MNNLKNHHSRGIYHHYTIEYKLQILDIAQKKTPSYIESEYGIDHHLLKKWKNDKSLLEAATNKKNNFKVIKNGGIPSTKGYDGYIANYVKDLRANSIPVNITDVIIKAKEIIEGFRDRSIDSLRSWAERFIKRMGFTYRLRTKTQTRLKPDIMDYIYNNIYFVIMPNLIKEKNLLQIKERIGKANEAPIFMEMNEKKTLNIIGEKDIKIKSFNKESTRISVMLTKLADGNTLPPFVVFSGKANGPKEQKLKSHRRVISGQVFVACQENSWVDAATMMIYLKEIWFKPSIYKQTKETLLLMDRARSHFSEDITNIFKKYNSNFLLNFSSPTS